MEFPLSVLMQALADYLLPMCRVTGMFLIMAGIGVRNVPTRIKTGLVVFISLIIMPTLPPVTNPDLMSGQMVLEVLL